MGGTGFDEREREALLVTLADDLRAAVTDLADHEISDADLDAAARLARSLRRRLDGPRRARWYEADAMLLGEGDRLAYLDQSPVRGRLNPIAPPLEIETALRPGGGRAVVGRARLGCAYEGPPHGVHGGWVAALLDELLGAAQGLTETKGVTATLRIRFRDITPIDRDLRLEAWVHEDRGRIVVVRGTCHAGERLTADAEGVFVRVDFNEVQERMRQRRGDDRSDRDPV